MINNDNICSDLTINIMDNIESPNEKNIKKINTLTQEAISRLLPTDVSELVTQIKILKKSDFEYPKIIGKLFLDALEQVEKEIEKTKERMKHHEERGKMLKKFCL